MLLQVHDELIFEAPDEEIEKTEALVKSVMEKAAAPAVHLSVPLDRRGARRRQLGRRALARLKSNRWP